MSEVKAQLNSLRLAPRKVRAVANLLKGKNVNDALGQLEYFVRRPAEPIKKLLNSAIANAENNFSMVKDNLYIKSIIVDEGVKLKRMRAKGFGRAAAIQKKTSHIRLILDEYRAGLRKEKTARAKKETSEVTTEETRKNEFKKPASGEARPPRRDDESRLGQGRPETKREIIGPKRGILGGLGKRFFQRKAI